MLLSGDIENPDEIIVSVTCECGKTVPQELLDGDDPAPVVMWIVDHASHGNVEIETGYLN